MKTIGLALVLILAACGKGATGDAKLSTPPPAGATSPAASSNSVALPTEVPSTIGSTGQTVTLRLLGARPPGPVRVRVAAVELALDDKPLLTPMTGGEIDLGDDQNAWEVMKFVLPADARSVAIRLQLDPQGLVQRDGKTRVLDLGGPPLSIVADAALIRAHSHVVLQLDLAQSLVAQGEQDFFLPAFTVRY
jgi:hypothetical protein